MALVGDLIESMMKRDAKIKDPELFTRHGVFLGLTATSLPHLFCITFL